MKILIAGDGKVGATLTRQLSAEGYELTLIDSNPDVLESSINRYDVMTVYGNCASMEILRQAEVEKADLLIAVTSADEVNLLCCTTAHVLNSKLHTIARIRNPEYAEQVYAMRDVFALSMAVNPELQAAREIERLLKYPGFLKRESFAKGRVEIVELRVEPGGKLCDVSLSSLNSIVHCKVLVCAVVRNGATVAPDGQCVLRQDDRIFVTASTNELVMLIKSLGIDTHKVSRVMLAGGGRVSYYLAQLLEKSGMSVQIIEQNRERCQTLAKSLPYASVTYGDASDMSLLESEGLPECDAFVTLTGLDEINMILSLSARQRGVKQVVTKLGHVEASNVLASLPLGSVVSPRELCCNTIVRYVRAMRKQSGAAVAIHSIANGMAEAIEFHVEEETLHCGQPLHTLRLKPGVLIACIIHGVNTDIPSGGSSFTPGDTLIVVTNAGRVINELNDIFE